MKKKEYRNFVKELEKLQNVGDNILIVNAGRMNHGKSSLFNSLLDKEIFKTGDIRVTLKKSGEYYKDGVKLIDTPGLDADKKDDKEAFTAYNDANMIIFVHTPKVGELHKDELERINQIKELFPSEEYFWNNFCLVLTFVDEVNSADLEEIEKKIIQSIKAQCNGKNYPIFHVSNKRYLKGRKENKEQLLKASGIHELRDFIDRKILEAQQSSQALRVERVNKLIKEKVSELKNKKQVAINNYNNKRAVKEKKVDRVLAMLIEMRDDINDILYEIGETYEYIESLKEDLASLNRKYINS